MIAHIHIHKAAGSTLFRLLRRNYGSRHCDIPANISQFSGLWRFTAQFYPRLKSISGHAVRPNRELGAVFSGIRFFAFVRDPIARAVSHYLHFVERGAALPPAEEWFRNHSNGLARGICGEESADLAIEILETQVGFVGLVERFEESMVLWKHWLGDAEFDLRYEMVNAARRVELKAELLERPDIRELLEELHQEDRRVYRHAVDRLYPLQVGRFPGELSQAAEELRVSLSGAPRRSLSYLRCKVKSRLIYNPSVRMLALTRGGLIRDYQG